MAGERIRAQVVIPTYSTLPKDRFTNTFYFINQTIETYETVLPTIGVMIGQFYDEMFDVVDVANYCLINSAYVNCYNMDEPEPRVPTVVDINTPNVNYAASVIPTEVSCVLSFQGDPQSGVSQRRRRGRVYIPGITAAMLNQSPAGSYPTFATSFISQVIAAAEELMTSGITNDIPWCVYSPTASLYTAVTNGWVDNSPDTQRRRSVDAVTRTVFPV
jgi:hypothetical protein